MLAMHAAGGAGAIATHSVPAAATRAVARSRACSGRLVRSADQDVLPRLALGDLGGATACAARDVQSWTR